MKNLHCCFCTKNSVVFFYPLILVGGGEEKLMKITEVIETPLYVGNIEILFCEYSLIITKSD